MFLRTILFIFVGVKTFMIRNSISQTMPLNLFPPKAKVHEQRQEAVSLLDQHVLRGPASLLLPHPRLDRGGRAVRGSDRSEARPLERLAATVLQVWEENGAEIMQTCRALFFWAVRFRSFERNFRVICSLKWALNFNNLADRSALFKRSFGRFRVEWTDLISALNMGNLKDCSPIWGDWKKTGPLWVRTFERALKSGSPRSAEM